MEPEKLYVRAEMELTRFAETIITQSTCEEVVAQYTAIDAQAFCEAHPNNWSQTLGNMMGTTTTK